LPGFVVESISIKQLFNSRFVLFAAYVQCLDQSLANRLELYYPAITKLANCEKVLSSDKPPVGCAILTISDKVEAHVLLKVSRTWFSSHVRL